jgi:formylglycine-generating enzyme required for sulfatase activity
MVHAIEVDAAGRRIEQHGHPIALDTSLELAPGSYILAATAPARYPTRVPVLVGRGEAREIEIPLPASRDVPPGMIFVPAGVSLLGAAEVEGVREGFAAEPEHPVRVEAFLIGEVEVTHAEYLEFLASLPATERLLRRPRAPGEDLVFDAGGVPVFTWSSATVRRGQPLCWPMRRVRRCQDWLRLPVSGVSFGDAKAYAEWLSRGRLPSARLCTEREWERAARGADGRLFANGDVLSPGDANFDETYDADKDQMGPVEVGSFGADRSPFGVRDLVGNVREWAGNGDGHAVRGGASMDVSFDARAAMRHVFYVDRDGLVGFRVCAPWPSAQRSL